MEGKCRIKRKNTLHKCLVWRREKGENENGHSDNRNSNLSPTHKLQLEKLNLDGLGLALGVHIPPHSIMLLQKIYFLHQTPSLSNSISVEYIL